MKLQTPPRRLQKTMEHLVREAFAEPDLETVFVTACVCLLLRWHMIYLDFPIKFHPSRKSLNKARGEKGKVGYVSYDLDGATEMNLLLPSCWKKRGWSQREYYQVVIHECAHAIGQSHVELSTEWYERQFGWGKKEKIGKDHYGA